MSLALTNTIRIRIAPGPSKAPRFSQYFSTLLSSLSIHRSPPYSSPRVSLPSSLPSSLSSLSALHPRFRVYEPKIVVILARDMEGLGVAGERIEVRRGYARNFLIPTGAAVYDTLEQRVLKGIEDFTFLAKNNRKENSQNESKSQSPYQTSLNSSVSSDSRSHSDPFLSSLPTVFSDVELRKYLERERTRLSRALIRFQRYCVYNPNSTSSDKENDLQTLAAPITKEVICKHLMEEFHFIQLDPSHITLPKERNSVDKFGRYAMRVSLPERLPGTPNQLPPMEAIECKLWVERKPLIRKGKLLIPGLTLTHRGTHEASMNIMALVEGSTPQSAIMNSGSVGSLLGPPPDAQVKITWRLARKKRSLAFKKHLARMALRKSTENPEGQLFAMREEETKKTDGETKS